MHQQITDCYTAIAINKNPPNRSQLVAVWRTDEYSKLYCQWVEPLNHK
jgi:hypothetical protein